MNDIFISYASPDRQIARQFAEALESAGWSVWWDRQIPVGESFDQVIEKELNAARCVVVLWSKQSVLSRWVKAESAAAADRECLVPAVIDEVAIPLEFKGIQTAMLMNWDGDTANPEFQRLVEAVKSMVGQSESSGRSGVQKTNSAGRPKAGTPIPPWLFAASAVALLIIVGLVLAKNIPHGPGIILSEAKPPTHEARRADGPAAPPQHPGPESRTATAAPSAAAPSSVATPSALAAPSVSPASDHVRLSDVTYKILSTAIEATDIERLRLRFEVRITNQGRYDVAFKDGSFRLLVDSIPRAPDNSFYVGVDGDAAKEGEVVFVFPRSTESLGLKITDGTQDALIPLQFKP